MNSGPEGAEAPGELTVLPHGNEAAVLDALRTRYFAGKIASTVAPMLVVLNPYEALDDRAATARH